MAFLRNKIVSALKKHASKMGVILLSKNQFNAYLSQRNNLLEAAIEAEGRTFDSKHPAEGVIFSFNRPVQLYALLESYFEKVKNPVPLTVQYGAKTADFERAYQDVKKVFEAKGVAFVKETNFRKDLAQVLENIQARKIFFLVDDIIFIDDVDMQDFCLFDTKRYIPTLRMAPYYTYSYTMAQQQLPPKSLRPLDDHADKLIWNWGEAGNEWDYPMSVDGHLFDTAEITFISKVTAYKAPNTYEGALMQFADLMRSRPGICYQQSKVLNVPCNKVQTENENLAGDITPESLLEKWQKGQCIDVSKLYGYQAKGPHEEVAFHFKDRK